MEQSEKLNFPNAFKKIQEEKGSLEAFRRIAKAESDLEERFVDEFNKSMGTRGIVSHLGVIEALWVYKSKNISDAILSNGRFEGSPVLVSVFSLSYLIDWLIKEREYSIDTLADRFYQHCSQIYKQDGMFPYISYKKCYGFLVDILSE